MALIHAPKVAGLAFGVAVLVLAARSWLPEALAEMPARVRPAPALDEPAGAGLQTAGFAGGCFRGVQAVFRHIDGVQNAASGYAGGMVADASYEQVTRGCTGHAEAVRVTFDPGKVSYGKLLHIFFTVALDPTQVNRQGPDTGTQYRSGLFVETPGPDQVARAYVAPLDAARVFGAPIVTRIDPAAPSYPAKSYNQDYLLVHPDQPYIAIHDMPKVRHLEAAFPANRRGAPAPVGTLSLNR